MPGSFFNLGRYVQKSSEKTNDSREKIDSQDTINQNKETLLKPTESDKNEFKTEHIHQEQTSDKQTVSQNPDQEKTDAVKAEKQTDPFQKQANIDILSRLTQRTNKCLVSAVAKAKEYKASFADTEHVLWGLLQDAGVYQVIADQKVSPSEIIKDIEASFKQESSTNPPQFSPRVKKALDFSLETARKAGYEFVSPEHLTIGLLQEGEGLAAQILNKHGVSIEGIKKKQGLAGVDSEGKPLKEPEKQAIDEYCIDITLKAKQGKLDPVVGRSKEIERVMHILSRRTKNNPVLVGEAGVGKTAIVEGLAQRIASGNVPDPLKNKRILSLDLMSLIAGASHRGDFEKRFKKLLSEIEKSQGTVVLFIDELHNLVGAGGSEGAMDASNMIKPMLARGELQTIGTTTVTEYRKYIEKDRAFERRFQPVYVNEPTIEQAIEMVSTLKNKYETFHKVSISDDAVEASVKLSARYIGDRFLPDKAIDLIDEAASAVRMPAISLPEEIQSLQKEQDRISAEVVEAQKMKNTSVEKQYEHELEDLRVKIAEKNKEFEKKRAQTTSVVTPDVIQDIVSRWTGIPISRMTESESEKLSSLEDKIHEKLIDQEEAVAAVAEAVRRGRAGFTSKKRPIGSFVFMGPTGVGKTELAKTLAEILFGSPEMMIRIDMTEYMEKHEVAKLIGAPPGYVGYEEGGQLTEAVRRKPYAVVLLDEVEKAHPDVFNILLQILDDGRLTDNKGRTISFKNTILICTSNVGTQLIQDAMLNATSLEQTLETNTSLQINTYAITPRGRELVTKEDKIWERQQQDASGVTGWKKRLLTEYFEGQTVENFETLTGTNAFPSTLSTHVISPVGEEIITEKDRLWIRNSTTAKIWKSMKLNDYFNGSTVVNAAPDVPEDQLPTTAWETHAITPTEGELLSFGSRVWVRDSRKNPNWQVLKKSDYLKALQITGETNPVDTSWSQHLFSPTGEELIFTGNKGWISESNTWKEVSADVLFAGENGPVNDVASESAADKDLSTDVLSKLSDKLTDELRKIFRPELLNRFDEILVFKPLSAKHMLKIVDLQVKALLDALSEQSFGLEVSEGAKRELAVEGFDPLYGARPLRRAVQRLIENPIASLVIEGKVQEGDTIAVDFNTQEGTFTFEVKRVSQPAPIKEASKMDTATITQPEKTATSLDNQEKNTEEVKQKEVSQNQMVADELAEALGTQEPTINTKETEKPTNGTTPPVSDDSTPLSIPHFNDMDTNKQSFGTSQPAPNSS
jgi:ATP-dependent Clp protease ATP-binding subunit ClpC